MEVIKIKLLQDYDVAAVRWLTAKILSFAVKNIEAGFIFLAHLFVSLR